MNATHTIDTQNTNKSNYSDESASLYYHSILKNTQSFGKWTSQTGTGLTGFLQQEGFAVMKYVKDDYLSVQLALFDGLYADKTSLNLLFDFEANKPHISPENGTVIFKRVWISERYNEYTLLESRHDYCLTNASIFFMNLKTNKPLKFKETVDQEAIGIQIVMDSPFCPFRFSTSLMVNNDGISETHKKFYISLTLTFAIFQCAMLFLLCNTFKNKPNQTLNVSAYSFMMLTAVDFYMLIFNAIHFVYSLEIYVVSTLVYLFLTFNMQKVIWIVSSTQFSDRRRWSMARMHIWPGLFLIVPAIISFLFNSNVVFYFTFLFAVPQIILNFQKSKKCRKKLWPVLGLFFPKLFFMAYLKLDLDNIFRYSPNLQVFWICIILLSIQSTILLIQSKWPRFGFEKAPSYFFFEAGTTALQDVCSICLEYCCIDVNSAIKTVEPLLKETERMIRTLCNHEFHEDCLRRWIKSKLECPYCRHALSAIPDPEDD